MKWNSAKFDDCLERVKYTNKIKRKQFQATGEYPVISQEADFVNGYWDDQGDVFNVEKPIVIFGDHTLVLKFIDFDFVLGADGVKILQPKDFLDTKFFYYFLLANPVKTLGYARHFRLLKELVVSYPPLSEQKRIVTILDEIFEGIDNVVANAEKNLANTREFFESYRSSVFTKNSDGWHEAKLGEVCEYFNGKAHEKIIDEEGDFIVVNSKFISSNGMAIKRTKNALFPLMTSDITMVLSDVPNGKALAKCFLVPEANKFTLNQRICVIRSNQFHHKFLFYQLNRNPYFLEFDNGENQTNLRKGQILSCPLFIPSVVDQRTIASRLELLQSHTNDLEVTYQRKLHDLSELKQSILKKAFSGELTDRAA